MDYIEKKIGHAEFLFIVSSRNTRNGFAHDCELYMNGRKIANDTAHYLNRTWECYRFQTVMLGAVDNAIKKAAQNICEAEKAARGWVKLTAARKAEIEKIINDNAGIKVFRALSDELRNAKYGTESERRELEALDMINAVLTVLFSNNGNSNNAA